MEEVRALVGHAPITYQVEVDGKPVSVQFMSDATLDIDGHVFHLDVSAVEGLSLYSLLLDGTSFEVVIDEHDGTYYAFVRGRVHQIKVRDAASRISSQDMSGAFGGEVVIRAPMPGLVIEVPMAVGEIVEANQAIVILESMKMENEIRPSRGGVVREVRVQAGNAVREGDILAILD